MTGRRERLPPGWDLAIPEALWPEVMISAVRYDLDALRSERVVQTLRAWREHSNDKNPEVREAALKRIKKIARALVDPTEPELSEPTLAIIFEPTQANVPAPKSESETAIASGSLTRDLMDTDSSVRPFTQSDVFASTHDGAPLEEATVAAYSKPEPRAQVPRSVPPPPPGPPPPPPADTNESLPLVEPSPRRDRPVLKPAEVPRRASIPPPSPAEGLPKRQTDEVEAIARLADMFLENKPADAAYTQLAPAPDSGRWPRPRPDSSTAEPTQFDYQSIVSSDWKDEDDRPTTASAPPAQPGSKSGAAERPAPRSAIPKSGVVRKRSQPGAAPPGPKRPRAALVQVKSLYNAIAPLCRELVPLSPERRARRFWARWREVSGDKGVSADFVEQLLQTVEDEHSLVSELIAEVHGFDLDSVRALVAKLEEEHGAGGNGRVRGGARSEHSVRVEGLPEEDARLKNEG